MLGLPPYGRGVYARTAVPVGRWSTVAINGDLRNRLQQVAAARAIGAKVYLYTTPERWYPDRWRSGLADLTRQAAEAGADGIIADPENGWTGSAAHRIEAGRLGAALAASGLDCGLTSYPSWTGLAACAAAAGGRVWGSPQLYGLTRPPTRSLFESWIAPWDSAFGGRVIPSIAGWVARPEYGSPDGYRAYLDALPRRGGYLAWTTGTGNDRIMSALQSYDHGSAVLAAVETVPGLVIAVIVTIAIAAMYRSMK